jgi:hypothetical protein
MGYQLIARLPVAKDNRTNMVRNTPIPQAGFKTAFPIF